MFSLKKNCKTYRIVSCKYPPIELFEDCADPEDLELLFELESRTNPRLQNQVGHIGLVKPQDRISGEGTSAIMAAFTHIGIPSRMTDGSYGVYYAGLELETAIKETQYWTEVQLKHSNEPATTRSMRVYVAKLKPEIGNLIDLQDDEDFHNPNDYSYSQSRSKTLRASKEWGAVYRSVRNPGGQCVGIFRPPILQPAIQSKTLRYHYDGQRIYHTEEVKQV